MIRDTTVVTGCEPSRRLVLDSRVGPLGRPEVDFRLPDHPDGSQLVVFENPTGGPLSPRLWSAAVDAAIRWRNEELCRRFRRMVVEREDRAVRDRRAVSAGGGA